MSLAVEALAHQHRLTLTDPQSPTHDVHGPQVSYLEIYNEQMYDLLAADPGSSEALAVVEDAVQGTFVSSLLSGQPLGLLGLPHLSCSCNMGLQRLGQQLVQPAVLPMTA